MWKKLLLAVAFLIAAFSAFVIHSLRSLEVEQLSDKLHVIRGVGSNVAVLETTAGAVIVDTMTTHLQGRLIRSKVKELTGQDTVLIINTHYHLDHTHGNPSFNPDIRVVATERTLSHLRALDSDFWSGDDAQFLPTETFDDSLNLEVGGEVIRLLHPGRGHTDGDLVVFIDSQETVVMGDLLFNDLYPNIDLEAGGSVQRWPETLERVLTEPFTKVIPGHGATTDRAGIARFQAFMTQLAEISRSAADNELGLQAVLDSSSLNADANFGTIRIAGISLGLDREFVLRRAWEEATGNYELKN
jgi:glyoxylase-like metal-dependent hydrolase (beta-lactamase superfamily II)